MSRWKIPWLFLIRKIDCFLIFSREPMRNCETRSSSVWLSECLSVYVSVCMTFCVTVCMSVCVSVRLFLSISLLLSFSRSLALALLLSLFRSRRTRGRSIAPKPHSAPDDSRYFSILQPIQRTSYISDCRGKLRRIFHALNLIKCRKTFNQLFRNGKEEKH